MERMDLTGKRFGRLTVVGEGLPFQRGRDLIRAWICQCDCGKVVRVRQQSLTRGNTKSCGCIGKDREKEVTAFGATRTLAQWEALTKIPGKVINSRLHRGWSPERAVTEPVRKRGTADDES